MPSFQFSNTMQTTKKRRCDHLCQQHAFKIQCTNSSYHSPLDVNVTFCPKYHRPPKQPETTFPSFNHDDKYFTSGFILQVDKKALIANQNQILHEHNKYVKEATQKSGKLIFPKPKKRHNVCGVCKIQYPNYFKHIMSEQHKLKLIMNEYNKQILSMQTSFQSLHPKSIPEYPIQIIKIVRNKPNEQQNRLALTEDETRQMKQEMRNCCEGVIRKQIEAMIISSDQQKQQSIQSNRYYQKQHSSSSSSGEHSKSKSQKTKFQENDSDSVQIISIKRPKDEKQKRSKKKKSEKQKKSKQKKHKSKNKKKDSSSSSSEDGSQQSSQKKRGSIGKKGPDLMPEVKRPLFKKILPNYSQNRPVQVLIEKSQIQNPQLDDQMRKILNNIVGGIKSNPPAQPRRKYQKGNDVSDSKSSVVGGSALSLLNLYQSKKAPPSDNKTHNTSASLVNEKDHSISKTIDPSKHLQPISKPNILKNLTPHIAKPNPILQKLNLTNSNEKNKIGLVTKKHVNNNMKTSTKIQKCIDLDTEQIVEMSCRETDKRKTELQLIMRYDQKKLANASTHNQSITKSNQ